MAGSITVVNNYADIANAISAAETVRLTGIDSKETLIFEAEKRDLTPVTTLNTLRFFLRNEFFTPLTGGMKTAPIMRSITKTANTEYTLAPHFVAVDLTLKQLIMSVLPSFGLNVVDYNRIPNSFKEAVAAKIPHPRAFVDSSAKTYVSYDVLEIIRGELINAGAFTFTIVAQGEIKKEGKTPYKILNPVYVEEATTRGFVQKFRNHGSTNPYSEITCGFTVSATAQTLAFTMTNLTAVNPVYYRDGENSGVFLISQSKFSNQSYVGSLGHHGGGVYYVHDKDTGEVLHTIYIGYHSGFNSDASTARFEYVFDNLSYPVSMQQGDMSDIFIINKDSAVPPHPENQIQSEGDYNIEAIKVYLCCLYGETLSTGGMDGTKLIVGATAPADINKSIADYFPTWDSESYTYSGYDENTKFYPLTIISTRVESTDNQNQETGQGGNSSIGDISGGISGGSATGTPTVPNDPPSTDTGTTPAAGANTSSVSAFMTIYNPTQSQLNDLAAYLWTDDFIENVKKLFANPMDVLIGLSMIYASPITDSEKEIRAGWVNTGVSAKTVTTQYVTIDCGEVSVPELYGSALDYEPYTSIHVYLPFIGIVPVSANDFMGSKVRIIYKVDIATGACLATIRINKGGLSADAYTFNGSCSVQIPITSSNYNSFVSSVIGAAATVGGTFATGGALAPALGSAALQMVRGTRQDFQRSGSLAGNAGVMGVKRPYILMKHPDAYTANNYNFFYGNPSNDTVVLGTMSGFTRVKDAHIEGIAATDDELNEIIEILKEGVLL